MKLNTIHNVHESTPYWYLVSLTTLSYDVFMTSYMEYKFSPSKSCEGRWVLNAYFFQLAHFSYDMTHASSTRWLANINQGFGCFPYIFVAHMNILLIIKVNTLVLIKWSYKVPTIMLTLEPIMVIIFWAHISNTCFFFVSLWSHTKPHTTQI